MGDITEIYRLVPCDEIIEIANEANVVITLKKLNRLKARGLIPKSERLLRDKRAYYPREIVLLLGVYSFLQRYLNMELKEIQTWVNRFKALIPYE